MSRSRRLRAALTMAVAAALVACSGSVRIDELEESSGDAQRQIDPDDAADLAEGLGDPDLLGCGNGVCTPNESCSSCPQDCGACPPCGDGTCDPGEACDSCSQDCGPCPGCGNGACTPNESCSSCPQDCGACPCAHATCVVGTPLDAACDPCVAQICAVDSFCCDYMWDGICVMEVGTICGTPCPAACGDGQCDASESCSTCAQDCGACPVCGDGWCDWTEDCSTCSADCGACPVCGDGACDWPEDCSTCSQDCGACPFCGDGACDWSESCSSCSQDCGACVCHDECVTGGPMDASCGVCEGQICQVDPFCCTVMWDALCVSEVTTVCGGSCQPVCGNGLCDGGESCSSCSQDCGACPVCGDGNCDFGESCGTCAVDCGACPACPMVNLGSTSPQSASGSTVGLADALTPSCGFSSAPEATYSFTAPADGTYLIDTFGSGYDTVLHVRDGGCQGAELACNDDAMGLQSQVSIALTAGQTVIIAVDGFASGQGSFTLNIP